MEPGEDDGRRTAVRYAGTSASGQLVISPKAYHCSLCAITCSGKKNLVMHFKGRKHQALMEEVSDEEELPPLSETRVNHEPAPSKPAFPFQPAFPSQPAGLCTQDWRFQIKSTTGGFSNLSVG